MNYSIQKDNKTNQYEYLISLSLRQILYLEQSFIVLRDNKLYKLALLLLNHYKKATELIDILLELVPINTIDSIDKLIYQLNTTINNPEITISQQFQKEASKLLKLCIQLKKTLNVETITHSDNIINQVTSFLPNLNTAFHAINNQKNLTLAKNIRRDIELYIEKFENINDESRDFMWFLQNSFYKIKYDLKGMSNPVKVLSGLIIASPFHILAPFFLSFLLNSMKENIKPIFINNITIK